MTRSILTPKLILIKTIITSVRVYISAWLSKLLFNEIVAGITRGELVMKLIWIVLAVIGLEVVITTVNKVIDYFSEKSTMRYNAYYTIKNRDKCNRLKFELHDDPQEKNELKQFINEKKRIASAICFLTMEIMRCRLHVRHLKSCRVQNSGQAFALGRRKRHTFSKRDFPLSESTPAAL